MAALALLAKRLRSVNCEKYQLVKAKAMEVCHAFLDASIEEGSHTLRLESLHQYLMTFCGNDDQVGGLLCGVTLNKRFAQRSRLVENGYSTRLWSTALPLEVHDA